MQSRRDQLEEALQSADTPRPLDMEASRRAFIRSMGLSAAGAAIFAGGAATMTTAAQAQAIDDVDILNFALNLEYLEAEFYLTAAFGRGLSNGDITGNVGLAGGIQLPRGSAALNKVDFSSDPAVGEYAIEIANDEEAHVKFLRANIPTNRLVRRPQLDLRDSFTSAARAAGLISSSQTFNAFANPTNFLLAAFIFEDVGVTAYKGAAPLISNPAILEAAAGILAVEAYHAGIIRTVLFAKGLFAQAEAISDARDSLDGGTDLDQGIRRRATPSAPRLANLVPTDNFGLAFSRTTGQVLNIVYLGGAANDFGFFPNRVNGTIMS